MIDVGKLCYLTEYEGYATVIGVTDKLKLVVRWYNEEGEQFTAVVDTDDAIEVWECTEGEDLINE